VYVSVNYIKCQAGKQSEYLDLLKNFSRKLYEYNFRQGRAMGYYVSSLLLPTGSETPYDISVIVVSSDLKFLVDDSIAPMSIFKKVNPEASESYMQSEMARYGPLRTIVKKEIFTVLDELDPKAAPTKYYTVDYMKTAAGKTADYIKLEREVWKPIHRERSKMGVLNDWVLLEKTPPLNTVAPYDYETVNFFNDMRVLTDSKYAEAIKKAFPNTDVTKSMNDTNASRVLLMEEVWKTEFFVDATNTKK
jgi:hypothetical protein